MFERIGQWLRRVPTGLWVFLLITQLLTFIARAYEVPRLNDSIERMRQETEAMGQMPEHVQEVQAKIRATFEEIRDRQQRDLAVAPILAVIFAGLAFWSLRNGDPRARIEIASS
jgi:hypothetical protein